MPASRRVMSARLAMPASCSCAVLMTLADSGRADSGTLPKPATVAVLLALWPVTVITCRGAGCANAGPASASRLAE